MRNNNDIRHGRHCVFLMHVHWVFVTQYRREVFTKTILDELHPIFAAVCKDFEAELVGWRVVVAQLLCRKLWWRTDCDYSAVY